MTTLLKRNCRGIGKWISDMFYEQYISNYYEAEEFSEARLLAQGRFGKDEGRGKK